MLALKADLRDRVSSTLSGLAAVLPSGGVSRRQTETRTIRGRCWPLNPGGQEQKEPSFWAVEAKKEGEVESRRGMDRLALCAMYSDCQPLMQSDSLYLTLSRELQRNCYTHWGGCHLWACHTCSEGLLALFLHLSPVLVLVCTGLRSRAELLQQVGVGRLICNSGITDQSGHCLAWEALGTGLGTRPGRPFLSLRRFFSRLVFFSAPAPSLTVGFFID